MTISLSPMTLFVIHSRVVAPHRCYHHLTWVQQASIHQGLALQTSRAAALLHPRLDRDHGTRKIRIPYILPPGMVPSLHVPSRLARGMFQLSVRFFGCVRAHAEALHDLDWKETARI